MRRIIEDDEIPELTSEDFKKAVGQRYEEVVGYAPSFYIAEVAGGSRVLD